MYNDDFLDRKLEERKEQNAFRRLRVVENKIDFCSNDYLGIVHRGLLNTGPSYLKHGSTGSRLLSGNSYLTERAEGNIAAFHKAQAAVVFNSGYDANVGLISCIAQKGDTIIMINWYMLPFATASGYRTHNLSPLLITTYKIWRKSSSSAPEIFL